jgi:hypothetical protein
MLNEQVHNPNKLLEGVQIQLTDNRLASDYLVMSSLHKSYLARPKEKEIEQRTLNKIELGNHAQFAIITGLSMVVVVASHGHPHP